MDMSDLTSKACWTQALSNSARLAHGCITHCCFLSVSCCKAASMLTLEVAGTGVDPAHACDNVMLAYLRPVAAET